MADLSYKTRGKSSPQGKPNVYFCSHPDDFDRYFEELSDEILEKQNCAIWHLKNYNIEYDEGFWADLSQMQLFVVPVTSEFLKTSNHAAETELKFAHENRIPVLPIMMEYGLEKLFNEKCGNMQFLDKSTQDPTAISYDIKLENYLKAVLIGDELADKIRAAFDAYVFLSYRKKDRAQAQELMRLIHKNEFCRDIAIWYDEFLVPGEDFNSSIEDAINKSDLFMLAVTPNLVNEINYVMTEEYPMACRAKKTIIPAELVQTSRDVLEEKFNGIPACVDARSESELKEALRAAVMKIALRQKDSSSEHKLFIGLAYLGGVDVEVDHDRALRLITEAAEEGLAAAQRQLITMYRDGVGVERNYEKVACERARLVNTLQEEVYRTRDEAKLFEFFDESFLLKDDLLAIGQVERAKEALNSVVELTGERNIIKDHIRTLCYIAETDSGVGDCEAFEGEYSAAADNYRRAAKTMWALTTENNVEIMIKHCGYLLRLGDTCEKIGDYDEALAAYKEALEIIDSTNISDNRTEQLRIRVLTQLSGLYIKYDNFVDASRTCYKIIKSAEARVQELRTAAAQKDLYDAYITYGDIIMHVGNNMYAREYYSKAMKTAEQLEREVQSLSAKQDLARAVTYMADMAEVGIVFEQLDEAMKLYTRTEEIYRELLESVNTPDIILNIAEILMSKGRIYRDKGEIAKAKEMFNDALVTLLIRDESMHGVEEKRALAAAYGNIGDIHVLCGELAEARECYGQALELWERIIEISDMTSDIEAKALVCIKTGDTVENCDEAYDIYWDAMPEVDQYCRLARSSSGINGDGYGWLHREGFLRIAEILYEDSNFEDALELASLSVELTRSREYTSDTQDEALSARTRVLIGDIYLALGNKEQAERQYRIITERWISVPEPPSVRFEYARALYKLCGEKKTLRNGKKFKSVVDITKELAQNHSYNPNYIEFYNLLKSRGQI